MIVLILLALFKKENGLPIATGELRKDMARIKWLLVINITISAAFLIFSPAIAKPLFRRQQAGSNHRLNEVAPLKMVNPINGALTVDDLMGYPTDNVCTLPFPTPPLSTPELQPHDRPQSPYPDAYTALARP